MSAGGDSETPAPDVHALLSTQGAKTAVVVGTELFTQALAEQGQNVSISSRDVVLVTGPHKCLSCIASVLFSFSSQSLKVDTCKAPNGTQVLVRDTN